MKLTLKAWLQKQHPDVLKSWQQIKKEQRRKYINKYMKQRYNKLYKAKTTLK